jgi:phosphoribosylformylglycinamidine synthase
MNSVKRIIVEKKVKFADEGRKLLREIKEGLHVTGIESVRILNVYDVEGLSEEDYTLSKNSVFSEPNVDNVSEEKADIPEGDFAFRIQLLPGQFDQRGDSAGQCIEIVTLKERPLIESSKIYVMAGTFSKEEKEKIKKYFINPVESHEVPLGKPLSLEQDLASPSKVKRVEGFIDFTLEELEDYRVAMGFAMSAGDIVHIQKYFVTQKRNPSITELKVLDTYWSDHCRHTTFLSEITAVGIEEGPYSNVLRDAYQTYLEDRNFVYGDKEKDVSLMDLAIISAKKQRKAGNLEDLDLSDEINACSIEVPVDVNGEDQDYLVMFKNETHNHPTEIEPFGGASTCLGGAIRDPLSGRVFVYQGMRVTGSADPRTPVEETIPGKLPQVKITREAAKGFSSYGNQIGLATGLVEEVYDEGFLAKRMEVGAVIGAAPKKNVRREQPIAGDAILIVGGETGRDGCGGATGSSKELDEESILTCGAEVQKGNAPVERKLQRLFRKQELSTLIKRCNDFGAGGVSVAIGELADSIDINLDKVPVKYAGLDGTELAISESQERMAVVIGAEDVDKFIALSAEENLNAVQVAKVTDSGKLRMEWRGDTILELDRDFIETNGVKTKTAIEIKAAQPEGNFFEKHKESTPESASKEAWLNNLGRLNVCSRQGLVENFDSSIGAATVLWPFGGHYRRTPIQGMVAKVPVLDGKTTTGTVMTFGYDPEVGKWSTYHGGMYSVIDSIARLVAIGGDYRKARFSMQEYFEKLGQSPEKWGKPFSSLLGVNKVLSEFNLAAIGGKDSMSGTFKEINVPPTVISFAVAPVKVDRVISPEFKKTDSTLVLFKHTRDDKECPNFPQLKSIYNRIHLGIQDGTILSAYAIGKGGLAGALSKMAFGNRIGMKLNQDLIFEELFEEAYGSIVMEVETSQLASLQQEAFAQYFQVIGHTNDQETIQVNHIEISLEEALAAWEKPLAKIFPLTEPLDEPVKQIEYKAQTIKRAAVKIAKPRVFIPAFPGTNSEYDTARAFEEAGAKVEIAVFKNLSSKDIMASVDQMVDLINQSQIIAIPGGFSAGDEPDGSGKFIASVFKNPKMKEAVMNLLNNRDGLMLGICNGFQALIKLGLLPYGEIKDLEAAAPTVTFNKIGRHVSSVARVKVASNKSPWMMNTDVGQVYNTPLSHGEGRFACQPEEFEALIKNGQIATQYVDYSDMASNDGAFNLNGSLSAVEGITSLDGRILGKMGHNERVGKNVMKNIPGQFDIGIFKSGVNYYK